MENEVRDLTPEELALAPDWSTHYLIDSVDGDVIYESSDYCWWPSLDRRLKNYTFDESRSRLIERKPFDITQHEWSDTSIENISYDEFCICLESSEYQNSINRNDAIAIAKHFNLTEGDLK